MNNRSVLELKGAGELIRAMEGFTPALEKKVLRQALRKAAKPILKQAIANAPVRNDTADLIDLAKRTVLLGQALGATAKQTERAAKRAVKHEIKRKKKEGDHYPGLLRDSLKIRAMRSKKGRVGVLVQTRDGDFKGRTFYGAFQEYGTSDMPGKGFIRSAYDTKHGESEVILANEISYGIDQVARELADGGA